MIVVWFTRLATYTITGLQTQLDAVITAISGGDLDSIRDELGKAYVILLGLPQEVSADGKVVQLRKNIDDLKNLYFPVATTVNVRDPRRIIRTGLSHG